MLRILIFLLPLVLAARAPVYAERPSDKSICDYYAAQRYGESNSTTQMLLMQRIVAYAYAGGSTIQASEANSTGIFNRGRYAGSDVFLRAWFDGSKKTTNLNNQAVGVNWLDGGGTEPLNAFLNGSTKTAEIKSGTNQYTLFSHWYVAFGKIYECSRVKDFQDNNFTPLTPAYVHKFMDLNEVQISYFIEQLIIASKHNGFSNADAAQLSKLMNVKYNTRCAPPVEGQLNSICFAKDCPLAAPSARCEVYPKVQPYGVEGYKNPSATDKPVLPTLPASSQAGAASANDRSSSGLSGGAIAGISIGAAVVALMAVGMCLFFFTRQRRAKEKSEPPMSQADDRASYAFPPQSMRGSNPHDSYYSRGTHDTYMTVAPTSPPPPAWTPSKPPQELGTESSAPMHVITPDHTGPTTPHVAEMGGPDPPAGWGQHS